MAVLGGYRLTRTGVLFIIGILVLGGLVTGGIFLVKNHGEAVRHDQAVKIAEQNLKDQSQTATQTTNSTDNSGETGASTDTSSTTSTGSATNTNTDTTTVATTTSTDQLPVTGIDGLQVVETSAILAVLAFSVTSFIASRRAADRL
jgi:cytoskeletal protein RodZ